MNNETTTKTETERFNEHVRFLRAYTKNASLALAAKSLGFTKEAAAFRKLIKTDSVRTSHRQAICETIAAARMNLSK
jgi:hypothetical protein